MSSGGLRGLATRSSGVLHHATVDLIRNAATKGSNSFLLGVAAGPSVFYVIVPSPPYPHLGQSDAVKHHVDLTIAAAIEAMTCGVSRPDRNRSTAVVHGKSSRGLEPGDAGGLAD